MKAIPSDYRQQPRIMPVAMLFTSQDKAILIAFFRKDKCTNDTIPYIGILIGKKYCIKLYYSIIFLVIMYYLQTIDRQIYRQ